MPFVLPIFSYEPDVVKPYRSRRTVELHCGENQETYVNDLEQLITATSFEKTGLENKIRLAEGSFFNASRNHNNLNGPCSPVTTGSYGSLHYYKENFIKAGMSLFGSG